MLHPWRYHPMQPRYRWKPEWALRTASSPPRKPSLPAGLPTNLWAFGTAAPCAHVPENLPCTYTFKVGLLGREHRALPFRTPKGSLGALLAGMAFSVGWTPCVGPILASIYTLAASGGSATGGALLLLIYSLGLGIPFLLAGVFFVRMLGAFSWMRKHYKAVRIASGILLVAYGVLMLSGKFTWLTAELSGFQLFEF